MGVLPSINEISATAWCANVVAVAFAKITATTSKWQAFPETTQLVGMGQRWIVESANSWLRAYGQLRRNTDRKPEHRHAALCMAIALLLVHRITHPRHSTWRPNR